MNYLIKLSTIVGAFLLFTLSTQAQYAKISFKTKQPLQVWVDGVPLHEGYAKQVKLRVNQGRTYDIKFYEKGKEEAIIAQNLTIGEKERKSDYLIKYNKRKQEYRMITKSSKDKISVADGLRMMGNMSYSVETTSVKADENGVEVKHRKESGGVDGEALGNSVDAVSSIYKGDKKKKKLKDDKTVVLLKMK